MKTYLISEVVESLNDLLCMFFKCNSIADNIAYDLEVDKNCPNASDFYHHNIAHWFTGDDAADKLSAIMIKMNARPVRKSFEGDEKRYSSISDMFRVNLAMFEGLAEKLQEIIEVCDYDRKNKYLVIELENMMESVQDKIRIANIWLDKVILYEEKDKMYAFDEDFEDFVKM